MSISEITGYRDQESRTWESEKMIRYHKLTRRRDKTEVVGISKVLEYA